MREPGKDEDGVIGLESLHVFSPLCVGVDALRSVRRFDRRVGRLIKQDVEYALTKLAPVKMLRFEYMQSYPSGCEIQQAMILNVRVKERWIGFRIID